MHTFSVTFKAILRCSLSKTSKSLARRMAMMIVICLGFANILKFISISMTHATVLNSYNERNQINFPMINNPIRASIAPKVFCPEPNTFEVSYRMIPQENFKRFKKKTFYQLLRTQACVETDGLLYAHHITHNIIRWTSATPIAICQVHWNDCPRLASD